MSPPCFWCASVGVHPLLVNAQKPDSGLPVDGLWRGFVLECVLEWNKLINHEVSGAYVYVDVYAEGVGADSGILSSPASHCAGGMSSEASGLMSLG